MEAKAGCEVELMKELNEIAPVSALMVALTRRSKTNCMEFEIVLNSASSIKFLPRTKRTCNQVGNHELDLGRSL